MAALNRLAQMNKDKFSAQNNGSSSWVTLAANTDAACFCFCGGNLFQVQNNFNLFLSRDYNNKNSDILFVYVCAHVCGYGYTWVCEFLSAEARS